MSTIYVKAQHNVGTLLPVTLVPGAYRMFACHGGEDTFMGDWTPKTAEPTGLFSGSGVYFKGDVRDSFPVGGYVRYHTPGVSAFDGSANVDLGNLRVMDQGEFNPYYSSVTDDTRVNFSHNGSLVQMDWKIGGDAAQTWTVYAPPDAYDTKTSGGILVSMEDQAGSIFSSSDVVSCVDGNLWPGKILVPYNGHGSMSRPLHHMLFRVDRAVNEFRIRWSRADGLEPLYGHGSLYLGIEVPQTVL